MTIEEALRWAFVFELPKTRAMMKAGPRMAEASTASYMELLTTIDRNRYGCVPDLSASLSAHGDAVLIGEAVLDLCDVEMGEAGDDVLGDLGELTAIERAECNARGFVIAAERLGDCALLMQRRALLGGIPSWESHGPVKRSYERGPNGKPIWRRKVSRPGGFDLPPVEVEIDGIDMRTRRPHPDAWQRTVLSPDPAVLAAERIEYQAFVLMLGMLVETLAGKLATIDATESRLSVWPWLGQEARPSPRVLLSRKIA